MRTKDEYIESLAAELKEWSAQIDLFADKAEIVAERAKLKYAEEVEALRARQHAAAEHMRELHEASGDAWVSIKGTTDKLWDDLRTGVNTAASKFK